MTYPFGHRHFAKNQTQRKKRGFDFEWSFAIPSLCLLPTLFSLLSSPLLGALAAPKEMPATEMPPPHLKSSSSSSYISIPIKDRALDFQQAFDTLKREKTSGKVYFQFSDGSSISNIIDITLLPNNSLILFRYNTNNQGVRMQVVKVEDIAGLSYY